MEKEQRKEQLKFLIGEIEDKIKPLKKELKVLKDELKELNKPVYKEVITFGEQDEVPEFLIDWLKAQDDWWMDDYSDWDNVIECMWNGDSKETVDSFYIYNDYKWVENEFILEGTTSSYRKDQCICDPEWGVLTLSIK